MFTEYPEKIANVINYKPKILILTLYSGENEFEACQASVAQQTDVEVEQVVFEGLGNVEAHRRLYSEIMSRSEEFDLFVKLDADMVITRPTALAEIAAYFQARPGLDHLETQVNDHFTGQTIFGAHVFSPNVWWDLDTQNTLFVDPPPQRDGMRIRDPDDLAIYVDHAPNPSPFQAFHFGFHRALKAFPRDAKKRSPQRMIAQLSVLQDLERNFETTNRHVLGLSVLAADMVMNGTLRGTTGDKADSAVKNAFETVVHLDGDALKRCVRQRRQRRKFRIWRDKCTAHIRAWRKSAKKRRRHK